MDGLPVVGQVIAYRIHWAIVLARAVTSDSIVLLETETQRIDYRMAALTGLWPRELRHLFSHREVGGELGVFESHGHGRRLERAANNIAGKEDAAMNRRGEFLVR